MISRKRPSTRTYRGRGRECLETGRSDLSVAERYVAELLIVIQNKRFYSGGSRTCQASPSCSLRSMIRQIVLLERRVTAGSGDPVRGGGRRVGCGNRGRLVTSTGCGGASVEGRTAWPASRVSSIRCECSLLRGVVLNGGASRPLHATSRRPLAHPPMALCAGLIRRDVAVSSRIVPERVSRSRD